MAALSQPLPLRLMLPVRACRASRESGWRVHRIVQKFPYPTRPALRLLLAGFFGPRGCFFGRCGRFRAAIRRIRRGRGGNPATTQRLPWYDLRSSVPRAYAEHILKQLVNSTVYDVSRTEAAREVFGAGVAGRISFIRRGKLPRTTSGKIQRRACPGRFNPGDLGLLGGRQISQTGHGPRFPGQHLPPRHALRLVHKLNEFLSSFLKGCVQLGSFPPLDSKIGMVPVDFVAKAVAGVITSRTNNLGMARHGNHPQALTDTDIVASLLKYGYPLRQTGLAGGRPWTSQGGRPVSTRQGGGAGI